MDAQPACAYCAGRTVTNPLSSLGIEPSALEQETPHEPDCPLLTRKPAGRWMRTLALALLPVAVIIPGCPSSSPTGPKENTMTGLDDGTISMLEEPAHIVDPEFYSLH